MKNREMIFLARLIFILSVSQKVTVIFVALFVAKSMIECNYNQIFAILATRSLHDI